MENCVSVITHGVDALTGIKKNRFQSKAAEIVPHMKFIHHITHRQATAAKKLETEVV